MEEIMIDISNLRCSKRLSCYPKSWDAWLRRGWHGVNIDSWASLYMPAKLSSDLLFFKHLGERTDHHIDFSWVIRRMQRKAVADLIRNQHLLPWTKKNVAEHFFVERRGQSELMLTDREHPIPVSQIKSMVLMAIEAGNFELARKRLVFCWLVPTVLCTKKTHTSLPSRCKDLSLPYLRYAIEVDGIPVELVRIDGTAIDPTSYSTQDLLEDMKAIPARGALIETP